MINVPSVEQATDCIFCVIAERILIMTKKEEGLTMLWVRNSEVQDFLKNRAGWYYRWVEGLVPKQQAKPLVFGTLFHKWLEVLYQTGNPLTATKSMCDLYMETNTSNMEQFELDDVQDLIEHVAVNYLDKYYDTDGSNWDVIATELSFAIPLDDEIGFTGTIDLIVRDKQDGKIWFLDHKTTSSIEKYDRISDIDTQITKYWWALQKLSQGIGYIKEGDRWVEAPCSDITDFNNLDEPPFGFIYNIILKDYPVPPKVLKDGSLSKAKNQKTTHDLYLKSLIEKRLATIEDTPHGRTSICDPDYGEILTYLMNNPKEYFKRIRVFRNQTEIDNTMLEFLDICREIKYCRKGSAPIYRTVNFDTIHDPYLPLYQAEIDGSDVEYLKETLYTKEDTNHEFPNH